MERMSPCRLTALLTVVALAAALLGCGNRRTVVITQRPPEVDELEVEVYDPTTNFVWEGVGVRILEVAHEWSGCVCPNDDPDPWLFTDQSGRVLFDSVALADLQLGFQEDEFGRAVLYPDRDADEAFILIEIDALGFDPVQVDVPVTWRVPAVLVEVPFQ